MAGDVVEVDVVVGDVVPPVAGAREEGVTEARGPGSERGAGRRGADGQHGHRTKHQTTQHRSTPPPHLGEGTRRSPENRSVKRLARARSGPLGLARLGELGGRAPRLVGRLALGPLGLLERRRRPLGPLGDLAALARLRERAIDRPLEPLPGRGSLDLAPELGEALEQQLPPSRDPDGEELQPAVGGAVGGRGEQPRVEVLRVAGPLAQRRRVLVAKRRRRGPRCAAASRRSRGARRAPPGGRVPAGARRRPGRRSRSPSPRARSAAAWRRCAGRAARSRARAAARRARTSATRRGASARSAPR